MEMFVNSNLVALIVEDKDVQVESILSLDVVYVHLMKYSWDAAPRSVISKLLQRPSWKTDLKQQV